MVMTDDPLRNASSAGKQHLAKYQNPSFRPLKSPKNHQSVIANQLPNLQTKNDDGPKTNVPCTAKTMISSEKHQNIPFSPPRSPQNNPSRTTPKLPGHYRNITPKTKNDLKVIQKCHTNMFPIPLAEE